VSDHYAVGLIAQEAGLRHVQLRELATFQTDFPPHLDATPRPETTETPSGASVAGHAAASGGTRKFLILNPLPRCSAGNKVVFLMLWFTHSAAR